MTGCDSSDAPPPPPPSTDAEVSYRTHCGACHQWDGSGVPGMYPALADVDWVQTEDPSRLIRIVLHGMVGPVHLNGELFKTTAPIMPGQGTMLSDERIAEVLTFVVQTFGGQDAAVIVTAEEVKAVREKERDRQVPWTEKELLQLGD